MLKEKTVPSRTEEFLSRVWNCVKPSHQEGQGHPTETQGLAVQSRHNYYYGVSALA